MARKSGSATRERFNKHLNWKLVTSLLWKIFENYQMNRVVQIHSLLSKIRAIVSESLAGKERF
jgi:hypothetical protein